MFILASALLLIGLLGIVVPVLPGLPFLVAAALLFTANSPGLRRRLAQALRSRTSSRHLRHLLARTAGQDDTAGLTVFERIKLGALRGVRALLPKSRR